MTDRFIRSLCVLVWIAASAMAQLPRPIAISVSVNTNGVLLAPSTLWASNSTALRAVVDGGISTVRGTSFVRVVTPRVISAPPTNGWTLRLTNVVDGAVEYAGVDTLTTSQGMTLEVLQVRAWTLASAFAITSATRDQDGIITTASVTWPDDATGTFTRLVKNEVFDSIDSFSVTHSRSGRTFTQPTVTRDASGAVTAQPNIIVSVP